MGFCVAEQSEDLHIPSAEKLAQPSVSSGISMANLLFTQQCKHRVDICRV